MKAASKKNDPFAYFITIRTYATWLHGDERGSIDPKHNRFNEPMRCPSEMLCSAMRSSALESGFLLDESMRAIVLQSGLSISDYFKWTLFAIHVRTNHVHIVVQSDRSKEKTMGAFKQYATRDLKKSHATLSMRR